MRKKVTLKHVAELAGVSPATVSMILRGKENLSFADDTVSRVKLAAQTLGYPFDEGTPGAGAEPAQPKRIAVFLPDITGKYYASIAHAIDHAARTKGFDTLYLVCHRDRARELRNLSTLAAHNIAGAIFSYVPHNHALVEQIAQTLPVVVIGNRDEHPLRLDIVETNSYQAGALLARHMLDLGHRNVAFIAPRMEWRGYSSAQRIRGVIETFRRECPGARLLVKTQVIPGGIDPYRDPRDARQQLGYSLTQECLREDASLTGIIAVNDYVAYGVIGALKAHGLRIPDDLSVCGSDDVFASALPGIDLTTVDHHIHDKCLHAFGLLYSKIYAPQADTMVLAPCYTRVEYASTLVRRGSTAPPRTAPVR